MAIKAIIFDLGNVLRFYDEREEWRRLAQLIGISPIVMLPPYLSLVKKFQRGELTAFQVIHKLCRLFGKPMPKKTVAFFRETLLSISSPNKPMLAFAKELRAMYRVGILSNTTLPHAAVYRKQRWTRNFDALFFSNEVGMRKPERRFYHHAAKQLNIEPNECLFTDDKIRNVLGARAAGMRAVHFRSVPQFKRFLKRKKLIPAWKENGAQ